jgi:tRNA modification GTPase
MFSTSDTIAAIATPPGRGGIGVVRLSGPRAHGIAAGLLAHPHPLEPRHATFTLVRLRPEPTANAIDHVVATYFPAPHSYTGEDVVELSAHGSPVVLRAIVAAAMAGGARLAEPGEFTLRAFLNGRIDLPQAEAVADLIDAITPLQARTAFDQLQGTLTEAIAGIDATLFDLIARLEASVDFPDEGYHFIDQGPLASAIDELRDRTAGLLADAKRGRLLREGLQIAIVGKPNVGKSSVFNALAGAARAIVTDIPGTTRDLVTESIDLDGLRSTLVDTAGLHVTADPVEAEGMARSKQAYSIADLTLVVLDGSRVLDEDDQQVLSQTIDKNRLIVLNKSDLGHAQETHELRGAVSISALTGAGLEELRRRIAASLDVDLLADRPSITNVRHIALVERAHEALSRARSAALSEGVTLPEEFVLADLQEARVAFEEVNGRRTSDDVLAHIFSRFCVGK